MGETKDELSQLLKLDREKNSGMEAILAELHKQHDTNINDQKQLAPMIRASQENTKFAAESVTAALADTGYYNEEEIESLSEDSPELYLATKKDRDQRSDCVSDKSPKGRIPSGLSAKGKMERKLLTKKGKEMYSKRGWMVEGTFGQLKYDLGFDHFMRRGKSACASEWKLMCSVHNLLKIFRFQAKVMA